MAKIGVLYMRDDVVHNMGACIGVKKAPGGYDLGQFPNHAHICSQYNLR